MTGSIQSGDYVRVSSGAAYQYTYQSDSRDAPKRTGHFVVPRGVYRIEMKETVVVLKGAENDWYLALQYFNRIQSKIKKINSPDEITTTDGKAGALMKTKMEQAKLNRETKEEKKV